MSMQIPYAFNKMAVYYNPPTPPSPTGYVDLPLSFKAVNSNSNIKLISNGSPNTISLEYKLNDGAWTSYNINDTISLNEGDVVSFSGANTLFNKDFSSNYYNFYSSSNTGNLELFGNLMSLVNWDDNNFSSYMFCSLFKNNKALLDASNLILPTTLAENGYIWFFSDCSNLTGTPILRCSGSFESGCYWAMFENCTNIVSCVILTQGTPASQSFETTFNNCNKLKYISVRFDSWINNSFTRWVSNVNANGIFEKPAALSEEFGSNRIPPSWTVVDL